MTSVPPPTAVMTRELPSESRSVLMNDRKKNLEQADSRSQVGRGTAARCQARSKSGMGRGTHSTTIGMNLGFVNAEVCGMAASLAAANLLTREAQGERAFSRPPCPGCPASALPDTPVLAACSTWLPLLPSAPSCLHRWDGCPASATQCWRHKRRLRLAPRKERHWDAPVKQRLLLMTQGGCNNV